MNAFKIIAEAAFRIEAARNISITKNTKKYEKKFRKLQGPKRK